VGRVYVDYAMTDLPLSSTASLRRWAGQCLQNNVQPLPSEFSQNDTAPLVEYLQSEGVISLVGEAISEASVESWTDSEQAIVDELLRCAALDMQRAQEVERIFSMLCAARVEFIVLKGEALAQTFYKKPYHRQRTDVDLIFPDKTSANRAREILRTQHYSDSNTLEGEFVGLQFVCSKKLSANHSLHFDIHSAICDYLWFARRLPYTELRNRTEQVRVGSVKVEILDSVYLLLHACLHHAVNRRAGIHDRLIWLYDIKLLCDRFTPQQWADLGQVCRDKDLSQTVFDALRSAQMVFPLPLPTSFLDELQRSALSEKRFICASQKRWQIYVADFLQNPGLGNKVKQLKEHLLPRRAYIVTKYELDDSQWVPYYYVKRLWQGAFKYSR
jgi:Uncharacterised nucleotidyltransferase